jgi:hypothetical protein
MSCDGPRDRLEGFRTHSGPSGAGSALCSDVTTQVRRCRVTEHWNGSAWTTVPIPDVGTSGNLAPVSTSQGAAAAWTAGSSNRSTSAAGGVYTYTVTALAPSVGAKLDRRDDQVEPSPRSLSFSKDSVGGR